MISITWWLRVASRLCRLESSYRHVLRQNYSVLSNFNVVLKFFLKFWVMMKDMSSRVLVQKRKESLRSTNFSKLQSLLEINRMIEMSLETFYMLNERCERRILMWKSPQRRFHKITWNDKQLIWRELIKFEKKD